MTGAESGEAISRDHYEIGDDIHKFVVETTKPGQPLPEGNRGSWYCPCAEPRHEALIRSLMETHDLTRFYDLGAGDLRLSAALADDYEVVAYETIESLAERAYKEQGEPDIELRTTDYYHHWAAMNDRDALYAAIGKTNELPGIPRNGIGVEGVDDVQVVYGESFRGVLDDD